MGILIASGWWLLLTPLKMMDFITWEYEIPNIWKVIIQMLQSPPTSNDSNLDEDPGGSQPEQASSFWIQKRFMFGCHRNHAAWRSPSHYSHY